MYIDFIDDGKKNRDINMKEGEAPGWRFPCESALFKVKTLICLVA